MSFALPGLPELVIHADERTTLDSFLDFYRSVFVRKMWGLTAEQLAISIPPSSLTLGGLWFHMAFVEDTWFQARLQGEALPPLWSGADFEHDPDWELNTAHTRTVEELATAFDEAVVRSRSVVARHRSLDTTTIHANRDGHTRSLRWLLIHMIEEYARRCGHADLLRESIDGRTGN